MITPTHPNDVQTRRGRISRHEYRDRYERETIAHAHAQQELIETRANLEAAQLRHTQLERVATGQREATQILADAALAKWKPATIVRLATRLARTGNPAALVAGHAAIAASAARRETGQ